jgi:putative phosphoesterase
VHDDVGTGERLLERRRVAHVAAAVAHLRPAVLGRVERTPRDAHDPVDPRVGLQQRQQPEAERAGRPGDCHREPLSARGHAATVASSAMQIAIISDTHMPRGARAIPPRCLERCAAADAILHAGDLSDLPVLELLRELGPPVHAVHGNVDSAAVRALLPARLELRLGAVRVGMTHIPGPARGRLERLRGEFAGCDAVIFGHTHMPEHEQRDGLQIFNPGSPTERRRAPAHTMGVATIDAARITFELLVVA